MTMTKRGLPDQQDVGMYRLGFQTALDMAITIARRDLRVDLAKNCGYVPAWQKGRWALADELTTHREAIRKEAADGEKGDGK